jgi:hypothetical protein
MDREIDEILKKNKEALKNGERLTLISDQYLVGPSDSNISKAKVEFYKKQEFEDDKSYN